MVRIIQRQRGLIGRRVGEGLGLRGGVGVGLRLWRRVLVVVLLWWQPRVRVLVRLRLVVLRVLLVLVVVLVLLVVLRRLRLLWRLVAMLR